MHILPFYDSSYNLLRAEEWGSTTFCSLKEQWICSLVNSRAAAFAKSHTTHTHTHTHTHTRSLKINEMRVSLVVQWTRIWCQCREHGFDPWSRKIPPVGAQWSLWATATEAWVPGVCALQQEKPPRWEAQVPQLESSFGLPQVEKAWVQQRRQAQLERK